MSAAVILAAGRGARLGRYTQSLPKVLVRAGGRSLLDWNLSALTAAGVERCIIVGGYRAERIHRDGITLVVTHRWTESGPVASLMAAEPARFEAPFLVVYGDCVHHVQNLRRMLACDADIAVAGDRAWRELWNVRHAEPLQDAETYRHESGALIAIGARASADDIIDAQFAGLVRFSPAGWRSVENALRQTSMPFDMTALLACLLVRGIPVADVPIRGNWCEVDSASDLKLCRRRLREGKWSHDWRPSAEPARWD
jgi:choline kinase